MSCLPSFILSAVTVSAMSCLLNTIAGSPSSSVMAALKVGREVHSVCAGNFVVAAEAATLFCATSSSKLVQLKFKRFAINRFDIWGQCKNTRALSLLEFSLRRVTF